MTVVSSPEKGWFPILFSVERRAKGDYDFSFHPHPPIRKCRVVRNFRFPKMNRKRL